MYKGKSEAMQRGAGWGSRDSMRAVDLYATVKPALTKREVAHFEFGQHNITSFVHQLIPMIEELGKGGIRKPKDVARLLNKKRCANGLR